MSRFRLRDLGSESLAGLLQRPGRSALTLVGTVLGIGSFVAIVGLSQTTSGQIGRQFSQLDATQVRVVDTGAIRAGAAQLDFPADADQLAGRIHGVLAAGVWWMPIFTNGAQVSALPGGTRLGLPLVAASPDTLAAGGVRLQSGVLFGQFAEREHQSVAVLGASAATELGITGLQNQPAIFINGQPFTVVGIIRSAQRLEPMNFGVTVPASTALRLWGPPSAQSPAQMLVHTQLGAARVVARQLPVAVLPTNPAALTATATSTPAGLQHSVTKSLNTLFLALAGVALVVGAVGIANTTLVAVLERSAEIGLRRALGARPRHIGVQFLAESTALGLFGGLLGACLGVATTLAVTIYHQWTALIDPRIVLAAPLAGGLIGLLAGLYPALRAAALEPADALRR